MNRLSPTKFQLGLTAPIVRIAVSLRAEIGARAGDALCRIDDDAVPATGNGVIGFDIGPKAFDRTGHTRVAPIAKRRLDAAAHGSAEVVPSVLAVLWSAEVARVANAREPDIGKRQKLHTAADVDRGPIEGRGGHVLGVGRLH